MTRGPLPSPIEKFLGADATRGGPFGLLRVTPESCTDDRIVSSLEWQLDRVAQHPEGDTPEADQVRLALHAAAAQLLDPLVRRHVLESLLQRGEAAPTAAPKLPVHPAAAGLTGLEQDALRTLAAHGGWNRQALERLTALASARGMGSHEIATTLRNLATRHRAPTARANHGHPHTPPAPLPPASPAAQAAPALRTGSPAARPATPSGNAVASRGRAASPTPHAPAPHAPANHAHGAPEEMDPGARHLRNLLLWIGGISFVVVACLVVAAILLTSAGGSSPSSPQASAPAPSIEPPAPGPAPGPRDADDSTSRRGPAPAPKESTPPATESPKNARRTPTVPVEDGAVVDPQALIRALAECAVQARREPESAAEKFPPLVRSVAARWCRFDLAQRRSADAAVLDTVFATASYPDVSDRVLGAIRQAADPLASAGAMTSAETWPAAWAAGILTRLSRERELPHAVSTAIDTALTAAVGEDRPRTGASFETGALAALRRIPDRLVAGEPPARTKDADRKADELFRPWIDAVSAVTLADAEAKERILVDGLQRVLTGAAEPTADQRVFDAIQTLVAEIKWRRGGPARPRLLDWFRDPQVTMQDLQVVTAALASKSAAEGVDAMMVLSVGSAPSDRQRLRSAYAKAWGIAESVGENKAAADWLRASADELSRSTEGMRHVELLTMAAVAARFNQAANSLWRGDSDRVPTLTKEAVDLPEVMARKTMQIKRVLSQLNDADGQWTAGYLSLGKNVALRQEKLTQLEKYTVSIGPVDAEQLVSIACSETPAELRSTGQRAVIKLGTEATVVNALLEQLPRMPRYGSVGAMVESVSRRSLPRPADPGWELEARRALVARLLELLAASGEDAKVDDLANFVFESYAARAGTESSLPAEGPDATRGAEAAVALTRTWRADAEAVAPNEYAPVPLDAIDRRLQGRRRLAQGPIQLFAAEQVSTAELMAYVVSAEHPRLAGETKKIIDDMAAARRQSRHIFEQLLHAERALLRLWRLRIGGTA